MTRKQKELLNNYKETLFISAILSAVLMPILPLPPYVNRVAMGVLSVFVSGTGFFLLGLVSSRVRMPFFTLNVLVQTLLTSTVIVATMLTMGYSFALLQPDSSLNDLVAVPKVLINDYWIEGVIGVFIAGLINATFQISRKLGPGVLCSWITGKYYTPREEELIFMFLDMKDSTAIAETLGAIKFSALVRDFFHDLTNPLTETKARVSHYIGDEAVIFWRPKEGLDKGNCIDLFFKMKESITSRSTYYKTTYGLVPEFKAGLHIGPVVATEVGDLKSEIVFHGDTLNTTARIQGQCNDGAPLLISDALKARLPNTGFSFESKGLHSLKGKASQLELFNPGPTTRPS